MVSSPDSALPGFPSTPPLCPLPTIQLGITRTWGLAVPPALPQEDSGPPTYFYIPRLHSWQDQKWLILSPFLVGQLCTRHCVRHMPPRASWQTKGKSRREHRQLQNRVCIRERPGPGGHFIIRCVDYFIFLFKKHPEPWDSPSVPWTQVPVSPIGSGPNCWESLLSAESSVLVKYVIPQA